MKGAEMDVFDNVAAAVSEEVGQTLTEYALILVFIALAVVGGAALFGGQVSSLYSTIVSQI
jgi:Flp pilus assembly pilin Flp